MNHRTLIMSVIGLTACAVSLVHASFIIELHNGRRVVTSQVWEEGTEIRFVTPHGTMGVPKTQVKHIKATPSVHDSISRSMPLRNQPDTEVSPTGIRVGSPTPSSVEPLHEVRTQSPSPEKSPGGSGELQEADAHAYHAQKLRLMSQLNEATTEYLEGSAARNVEAKHAALSRMRAYSKQIIDLGEVVKRSNGGVLPPWWAD